MTPDDLARLKALAERATPGKRIAMVRAGRNPPHLSHEWQIIAATAPGHGIYSDHPGGCSPAADMEFIAACDPSTILALIEAATPVPAGEFGERLSKLWWHGRETAAESLFSSSRTAVVSERQESIAALTRTHATLLAERDAARAEVERLREALRRIADWRVEMPDTNIVSIYDQRTNARCIARAALETTP